MGIRGNICLHFPHLVNFPPRCNYFSTLFLILEQPIRRKRWTRAGAWSSPSTSPMTPSRSVLFGLKGSRKRNLISTCFALLSGLKRKYNLLRQTSFLGLRNFQRRPGAIVLLSFPKRGTKTERLQNLKLKLTQSQENADKFNTHLFSFFSTLQKNKLTFRNCILSIRFQFLLLSVLTNSGILLSHITRGSD